MEVDGGRSIHKDLDAHSWGICSCLAGQGQPCQTDSPSLEQSREPAMPITSGLVQTTRPYCILCIFQNGIVT